MKKFDFVNKIVRQGNSLCVRIPSIVVKQGNLREGMEANIIITPPREMYKYNEKNAELLFKVSNSVKELDRYDKLKKRFFIMLNFDFLSKTVFPDENEAKKRQVDFINERKKEFGDKLIEEFIEFSTVLNEEAFETEGEVVVLKTKYQKFLD